MLKILVLVQGGFQDVFHHLEEMFPLGLHWMMAGQHDVTLTCS